MALRASPCRVRVSVALERGEARAILRAGPLRDRSRGLSEPEHPQRSIAAIIAKELPGAGEPVIRRITERALEKLQRLIAELHFSDPELDEKAAYQVARSVADELPTVDQAVARRIGLTVADRLFDLFPESI